MSSGIKSAVQVGRRSALGIVPTVVLIGMILLVTLHPVVAEDFWWHLARGRSVWEGHLSPARHLLAFEPNSDADWLSGLPWYAVYELGGVSFLSWLPTLLVTVTACFLARSVEGAKPVAGRSQTWLRVALVFLGVVAINQSTAPSPALFDLAGVILFWHLSRGVSEYPRTISVLWLCQFLWSNFAPLSLLGPIIAFCKISPEAGRASRRVLQQQSFSYREFWRCLFGLLIVGSMTPRGIFTFWDSLRTLLPWTVASLDDLNQVNLQSALKWPLELEGCAFLGLLTVCTFRWWKQTAGGGRIRSDFVPLIMTTVLAFSARGNLGPAALWLTLEALSPTTERSTAARAFIEPARREARVLQFLAVAFLAVAIMAAAGWIPNRPTRIGWGLAPQLEPMLIEHVLQNKNSPVDGTAYCSGVAEAGMLAWIRPGSIRPADAPCRALLSGRLKGHVNLESDLALGWRDQHRRSEGGWGGWWLELFERRTRLLLLSPQRTQAIHELESANWKPLAIDTPCLPYALAGDPVFSPRIVFAQKSLSLVDHGEWTYTDPQPAGIGSNFDLFGWVTGIADPLIAVRQAQTLYAMERHFAALRVLKRELLRKNRLARHEFMRNQEALAYREFLATGVRSEWRTLAYEYSGGQQRAPALIPNDPAKPFEQDSKLLIPAVSAYVAGTWDLARDQLKVLDTPSALLALAQVELELGHPQLTAQIISELTTKFPDSSASIAGQHVLSQISE